MSKAKKESSAESKLCLALAILLILGFAAYMFILEPMKEKVAETVVTSVLEKQMEQAGVSGEASEKAKQIYENMDEADKQEVQEIVSEHLNPSEIAEVSKIYKNEGASGLKEYAQDELSEEEISTLTGLYEKYGDQITNLQ